MKKALPWFLAALSGIFGFLGYAGFDLFFLEWVFLLPLLWAIRRAPPGRAFLLGWLAGAVGHGGGFYWLVHMLTVFAGMNRPIAFAALLVYAAFNGLSFAVFAWGVRRLSLRKGWSVWWTSPLMWTAMENVFPFVFPNYIGASQYPLLPLTQLADITGIVGVSGLLIWCNATVFCVVENRMDRHRWPVREVALFLSVTALAAAYGMVRISQMDTAVANAASIRVAVIQAGKGESYRHRHAQDFIRIHQEMSRLAASTEPSKGPDLLIWPETVITPPIPREVKKLPCRWLGRTARPVLFGALTSDKQDGEREIYASALLTDERCRVQGLYDKRILVPFGEYIPLGDRFPLLYKYLPYTSRFRPGESSAPLSFKTYRLSLNICYEDLFSGFIRRNMLSGVSAENTLPHAIINLTNDSWYGDTVEPMQHLVLASFRAIEHRRSLVRATNTGISAIIDPVGRLNRRTGQWKREILRGDVPMLTGRTIFSHAGNWFGWTVSLIALGLLLRSREPGAGDNRSD